MNATRPHWWLINIGSGNGWCLRQQAITWTNVHPGLCRHMASFNSIFSSFFFLYLNRNWTQGTDEWLHSITRNCLLVKGGPWIKKIEEIVCLACCGGKQTTDRILLCSKCPQVCQNVSNNYFGPKRGCYNIGYLSETRLKPKSREKSFPYKPCRNRFQISHRAGSGYCRALC